MAFSFKKIFSRTIFVSGTSFSFVYLISCLTPYINPVHFYPLTFLALMFPYLLAGMGVWLVIGLIFYRKSVLYFLLLTALGFQNIFAVFSFHTPKEFVKDKGTKTIRLLSWNVRDFIDSQEHSDTVGNKRRDIIAFIKNTNADIVCIQDFLQQNGPAFRSSLTDVIEAGGFSYHYLAKDFDYNYPWASTQYGTAIFSKYPILDSGKVDYPRKPYPESLAYADIKVGKDTLRIFNTHLRSLGLSHQVIEADTVGMIQADYDFLVAHPEKHSRIRYYDLQHVQQVLTAKPIMDGTKHPYIFCADMNTVPSSYVYHQMSKGLTDAFLAKGSWLGGTYEGISPTLRIDVVLMSKQLKPVQYYSPRLNASDHFPIVTDIQFR